MNITIANMPANLSDQYPCEFCNQIGCEIIITHTVPGGAVIGAHKKCLDDFLASADPEVEASDLSV